MPLLAVSGAAAEPTHALAVHAPSPTDPRYRRMVLQYTAIEALWREAGVTFVGLPAGGPPEVMGALPSGLSTASVARAAPPGGGFGVRLIAASGRLVHSADAEVPRAVLLALVDLGGGAPPPPRTAAAAPSPLDASPSLAAPPPRAATPAPLPERGPPVAHRPAPLAGPERTDAPLPPSPETAPPEPTALDWEDEPARSAAAAPPATEPASVWGATPSEPAPASAAAPARRVGPVSLPPDRSVARAADASSPVPPPPSAPAPPSRGAWSLWSGAAEPAVAEPTPVAAATGGRAVTDGLPPLDPAPTGALAARLPAEVVDRAREAAIEGHLARARAHDGFEAGALDAALPLETRARMRFARPPSIHGPDLGLALLVTGSCGAAVSERPARRGLFGWG